MLQEQPHKTRRERWSAALLVAPEAIAGVVAHEAGAIGGLLGDGATAILVDMGRDALALDGSEDGGQGGEGGCESFGTLGSLSAWEC